MTDKDAHARAQNERWEAICGALTGDMEPDDEYGDIAVGRAVFGDAIDAAYRAAHAAAIEAAAGVCDGAAREATRAVSLGMESGIDYRGVARTYEGAANAIRTLAEKEVEDGAE